MRCLCASVGSNPPRPTFFKHLVKWPKRRLPTAADVEGGSRGCICPKVQILPCLLLIGEWRSPVAHLFWVQVVASSNLASPTIYCPVAQLAERVTLDHQVQGSSPCWAANLIIENFDEKNLSRYPLCAFHRPRYGARGANVRSRLR